MGIRRNLKVMFDLPKPIAGALHFFHGKYIPTSELIFNATVGTYN